MAVGVDTTFLIQLEILEANGHKRACAFLDQQILQRGESLALAPQVLAEFIHIVTDAHRFASPLAMASALQRSEFWWEASEVQPVFPNRHSVRLFLQWMSKHHLGRKRILDTMLAATYVAHGIHTIISSNTRDYSVYQEIEAIDPTLQGGVL